eukprot:TRINITY_DN72103_c0_g1_i1.p2 TRINITY_DN72103_c0_g1~~TRINITY_DN72103_c0_g1_i1.p2  ORF type:complete len:300 (+),score=82.59 TRINITY_DN72103_c0_g1_i1:76-900(+)
MQASGEDVGRLYQLPLRKGEALGIDTTEQGDRVFISNVNWGPPGRPSAAAQARLPPGRIATAHGRVISSLEDLEDALDAAMETALATWRERGMPPPESVDEGTELGAVSMVIVPSVEADPSAQWPPLSGGWLADALSTTLTDTLTTWGRLAKGPAADASQERAALARLEAAPRGPGAREPHARIHTHPQGPAETTRLSRVLSVVEQLAYSDVGRNTICSHHGTKIPRQVLSLETEQRYQQTRHRPLAPVMAPSRREEGAAAGADEDGFVELYTS